MSKSAVTRAAAPKIVSPSRKGLRNSVLSPYKRTSVPSATCSCARAAVPRPIVTSATSATTIALSGSRGRIYRRGRTQAYIEGDVGISDAAIAVPPRGTRFNYLATGTGGLLIRVSPRVHAVAALEWIHVSNNSLKGPGRNPDTEAV